MCNIRECTLISALAVLTQRQDGDVISVTAQLPQGLSVHVSSSVTGDLNLVSKSFKACPNSTEVDPRDWLCFADGDWTSSD